MYGMSWGQFFLFFFFFSRSVRAVSWVHVSQVGELCENEELIFWLPYGLLPAVLLLAALVGFAPSSAFSTNLRFGCVPSRFPSAWVARRVPVF